MKEKGKSKAQEIRGEKNKKVLGMLVIMFPSALLFISTDVQPPLLGWSLRILIFGFQYIIVKNYLDEFYGE